MDARPTRRLWKRFALVGGATVVALGLGEVCVRLFLAPAPAVGPAQHRAQPDKPWLYGLDPAHPEVSSQGLRDREFAIPKPAEVTRVMLLGDSVVFGVDVAVEEALSRQLQERLRAALPARSIEVMNAGVHGWSPHNELAWFEAEGVRFQPDLVVVVFCLNDVADPHLHWQYAQGLSASIPAAALPDADYHRDHAAPRLAAQFDRHQRRQRQPLRTLRRSALFRLLSDAMEPSPSEPMRTVDGRSWRTRITGEDELSIDVLMDVASPQWRWLRGKYTALRDAVRSTGAELVVASVPLAYQLEPDYPFVPQDHLAAFCAELGVDYVSALPALRGTDPSEVFLGESSGREDIWHLTAAGLGKVADALTPCVTQHLK